MVKYNKVYCNILKCTEYQEKGKISSVVLLNGKVVHREFDGTCCYDGKTLEKNVPFVELCSPFDGVYVPENRFNLYTKLLITLSKNHLRRMTLDRKRFYTTFPFRVGDIFVKVSE